MVLPQLAHPTKIIGENISVASGKPVVLKYRTESVHHIAKFVLVVTALRQFTLQLVQFENRPRQTGLVTGERKGGTLEMLHVLADTFK